MDRYKPDPSSLASSSGEQQRSSCLPSKVGIESLQLRDRECAVVQNMAIAPLGFQIRNEV